MESDPESIVENDLDKNRHKQIVFCQCRFIMFDKKGKMLYNKSYHHIFGGVW